MTAPTFRAHRTGCRVLRGIAMTAAAAVLTAAVAAVVLYLAVARSLPALDGELSVTGVAGEVTVERDALGVATITGATRLDVACATGFVHAQERYFQMDLLRRRAAGEMAELVGPAALPVDRAVRVHRLRARAALAVARMDGGDRALFEAYAAGVNAGLAALRARPPEYLVLRSAPRQWQVEDSVLVMAAMFLQLTDPQARRDGWVAALYDTLPAAAADFVTSLGSDWDTPLAGDTLPPPPIPGPEVLDLRASPPGATAARSGATAPSGARTDRSAAAAELLALRGSNNWAVAGAHTASGAALVANDPHLAITVPGVWYRVSLAWANGGGPDGTGRAVGATIPGLPQVIIGSNGAVAWVLTTVTGDFSDLVVVEPDPSDAGRYLTPAGPRVFARSEERIAVRGAPPAMLEVRETIWGPIVGRDATGRELAARWSGHDPEALNLSFVPERATALEEALAIANRSGLPPQNFVVGDTDGHIAWTIAGRIPRRAGCDGRMPASWAGGTCRWDGYLTASEAPRIIDPPSGRLVTANNRLVGGEWLRALGNGGYDTGARARQIREGLSAIDRATPRDMLAVQLDDRALLLERWRRLALDTLGQEAVKAHPVRAEFRRLVESRWTGRASVDSVGYLLVRDFRTAASELALAPLYAGARARDASFPTLLGPFEGPAWQLVTAKPRHLLDPRFTSWDELLLAAVDRTISTLTAGGAALAGRTWGARNLAAIRHPLSQALPFASDWLDIPAEPLAGDVHMPRVHGLWGGQSLRMAVSPGREGEGLFSMPVGQSGHPLSPHYRDMHGTWARGEATPFLPGPPVHRLVLAPERGKGSR